MFYSQPLTHLIEAFQRLPGIGPKSAQRIAFHMLKMPMAEVQQFTQAVVQAKEQIASCPVCFNLSSLSPCEICRNPNKQKNLLCVVCDPRDVFAIERTGEYQGA